MVIGIVNGQNQSGQSEKDYQIYLIIQCLLSLTFPIKCIWLVELLGLRA